MRIPIFGVLLGSWGGREYHLLEQGFHAINSCINRQKFRLWNFPHHLIGKLMEALPLISHCHAAVIGAEIMPGKKKVRHIIWTRLGSMQLMITFDIVATFFCCGWCYLHYLSSGQEKHHLLHVHVKLMLKSTRARALKRWFWINVRKSGPGHGDYKPWATLSAAENSKDNVPFLVFSMFPELRLLQEY